ncbi:hypothetical protein GT347_06665 [Xylophilus rhododendri]|uniref:Tripartite tricarboxylate transporter family receptor n=1 Tax=Xylophilus rhododendri TaxID=2697032 RepID=A0A857J368_9BURK|nr:hypothetical protein GT347_06665 [Xylophilus rhododendri]
MLAKAAIEVLQEPATIDSLVQKGFVVTPGDAARLASVATQDYARWGKVIKAANVSI